jgi:hypothetical protein
MHIPLLSLSVSKLRTPGDILIVKCGSDGCFSLLYGPIWNIPLGTAAEIDFLLGYFLSPLVEDL